MSILNVNQIQPVGSGQTVTISAANITASSSTITANTFSGSLSSSGVSTFSDTVNVGAGKSIRLYGASSGYSDIIAAAGSASTTFTLPANGGSNGQYLQTNGSGALSFADPLGSAAAVSGTNFQFNSGYGSVATAYGCRAWVNFNGTGAVAIRASGNVSSITDINTGQYDVNFSTAMPDVNYCAVTDCGALTSGGTMAGNIATGSFRMLTMNGNFANEDRSIVFASVFR